MTRTYNQMYRRDKYSQHSSITWPVWQNGLVFVYRLSGSGCDSRCSHLKFRFRACFEQGVPWHSGNYGVWIHSETRAWHDKNIQSSHIVFLIKKRRSADAQYWIVTLSNWKKQPLEVFYKNAVLTNFEIFRRKTLKFLRTPTFEEHLRISELSLRSDRLELCFWIAFKTISTQ